MNTTGYLILIAALLIVAGLLLYARFVSRARENSEHHAPEGALAPEGGNELPMDVSEAHSFCEEEAVVEYESSPLEPDTELSSADLEEKVVEPTVEEISSREGQTEEVAEEKAEPEKDVVAVAQVEPIAARSKDSDGSDDSEGEEKNRKGEYLDELQEAAAGLAMLMRSSPVSKRSSPVVYAPDEAGRDSESSDSAVESEVPTEKILMEVADPVEAGETPAEQEEEASTPAIESADEVVGESVEPVPELEDIEVSEEVAEQVAELAESVPDPGVLEILGVEVTRKFDEIDSGLDALEELVNSIESSLADLEPLEWSEEPELEEGGEISEAA